MDHVTILLAFLQTLYPVALLVPTLVVTRDPGRTAFAPEGLAACLFLPILLCGLSMVYALGFVALVGGAGAVGAIGILFVSGLPTLCVLYFTVAPAVDTFLIERAGEVVDDGCTIGARE